jgi:hypothetical protein
MVTSTVAPPPAGTFTLVTGAPPMLNVAVAELSGKPVGVVVPLVERAGSCERS